VHLVLRKDHIRVLASPSKGESVELFKQAHPLAIGEWHRVRLGFSGETMTATFDDTPITAMAPCVAVQELSFGLGGDSGGSEGENAGAMEFRRLKNTCTP
jgi:hypothetical protein